MVKRFLLLIALLLGAWSEQSWAQSPLVSNLEPVRILEAQNLTDDDDEAANDISGIACVPPTGAARICLVINDEDRFAQSVKLEGNRVIGGPKFQLIDKRPSDSTIGNEPQGAACSEGTARFKDLDGEGVAFAAPYFYIAGSHGCSRNSKFRASSFILARVPVDAQGNPTGQAETTYRLAEALRTAPGIGPFFGKDLNADGINIEGIAVIGGNLIVGLRAPVLQGNAFLVSVSLGHLFSRDRSPPPSDLRVIPLALGQNVGIRDLASLDDGRLLVLAGSAQDQQDVSYSFFLADPASSAAPKHLATLREVVEDGAHGKAEGVVVLDADADALRVLVMFDSLPGGGPREYRVPLR
jgi:hypothetical protein